jgi:transposase
MSSRQSPQKTGKLANRLNPVFIKETDMKKNTENQQYLARGKTISVGIDVHKRSWHVTALSDGVVLFSGSIPPSYDALMSIFRRFDDCEIRVAYEAGPCGLYDLLDNDNIRCTVVPPNLIPTESGNKVKTDKIDSKKLAFLLEAGMLKAVFVLSEEERMHRELLRTRRQLVEHRTGVIKQIKAKFLYHSIDPAYTNKREWTAKQIKAILGFDFPYPFLKKAVEALLETYSQITLTIRSLTKEIRILSNTEKYKDDVALLMTVPGIARLTAMEILTELGDLERFGSNDQLASFLGLTPSEYTTGEYTRKGHITRCGNKRIRTCLVESSWKLISHDGVMREKYDRIKYRRGAKRAIVAIARNLSGRIRGMMLRKEQYVTGVC